MSNRYELWERRAGGVWKSRLSGTKLEDLNGQVYRWSRMSLGVHSREWVILPVGQFPDETTQPTHTNAHVVARGTGTGSTRRKSAPGSTQ